jgi:hypothetical protein
MTLQKAKNPRVKRRACRFVGAAHDFPGGFTTRGCLSRAIIHSTSLAINPATAVRPMAV